MNKKRKYDFFDEFEQEEEEKQEEEDIDYGDLCGNEFANNNVPNVPTDIMEIHEDVDLNQMRTDLEIIDCVAGIEIACLIVSLRLYAHQGIPIPELAFAEEKQENIFEHEENVKYPNFHV